MTTRRAADVSAEIDAAAAKRAANGDKWDAGAVTGCAAIVIGAGLLLSCFGTILAAVWVGIYAVGRWAGLW